MQRSYLRTRVSDGYGHSSPALAANSQLGVCQQGLQCCAGCAQVTARAVHRVQHLHSCLPQELNSLLLASWASTHPALQQVDAGQGRSGQHWHCTRARPGCGGSISQGPCLTSDVGVQLISLLITTSEAADLLICCLLLTDQSLPTAALTCVFETAVHGDLEQFKAVGDR